MNVQIPVRDISPRVIHNGRLLIFWVQITTTPANKVENGESRFVGYQHRFSFQYSEKRANGTWTPPQKLLATEQNGLSFERLDDPIEEPAPIDLASLFSAAEASDKLKDVANSETIYLPSMANDFYQATTPCSKNPGWIDSTL